MTPEYIVAIGKAIALAIGVPIIFYWFGRIIVEVIKAPTESASSLLDKVQKPATWKGYSYPYASNEPTKKGTK